MRRGGLRFALIAATMAVVARASAAETAADAYAAMGIETGRVLTGTVVANKVIPGDARQVVALATFLTGKKEEAEAVGVRLAVLRKDGETLAPIYTRDFAAEKGGLVGRGELELLDLDGDGVNEIVVTWDDARDKLIRRRSGEVIVHDDSGFRVGWTGDMEYDATQSARDVPAERRDRFLRKLDLAATLKTRGVTLFFTKTVLAVAGERLPEPKIVRETFPLRSSP